MQSVADRTIDKQKEELFLKIQTLADQYGWIHGNRTPYATLVKIISSLSCEKRIMEILENNRLADVPKKFDPYYVQKSEFATAKILDSIKTQLSASGLKATILTEVPFEVGRYDIVVALENPSKVDAESDKKIKIEVKASLGIDLEQIQRYLWDFSTLILSRIVTRQVVKLRPSELQSFVNFTMQELDSKLDRLLSNKLYAIPGTDCTSCQDVTCRHFQRRKKGRAPPKVLTFSDVEFGEDLKSFFENLPYVASQTALMVVEELQDISNRSKAVPVPTQIRIGRDICGKNLVGSNEKGKYYESLV
jgi:hypothetical protein